VCFSEPLLETRFRGPAGRPCVRGPRSWPRSAEADQPPARRALASNVRTQIRIRLRETSWRLERAWSVSPAMNSWATCRVEFDAMGAVLGHGFHPLKARLARSIPNLRSVHRQGRTPKTGAVLAIETAEHCRVSPAVPWLGRAVPRSIRANRVLASWRTVG
jgi:hypothetical protein